MSKDMFVKRDDFLRLSELIRLCAATMRVMAVHTLHDGGESSALDLASELDRISFEARRLVPNAEPERSDA